MLPRTSRSGLLGQLCGSGPFRDYCQERGIAFATDAPFRGEGEDTRRWAAALAQLPHEQHARVELELAIVEELSTPDGIAHLLEADSAVEPPALLPAGPPLALWYLLYHPAQARTVFFHQQTEDGDTWRSGRAEPGLALADLGRTGALLADGLRAFFRTGSRAAPFCAVEGCALADGYHFVARVGDRLRYLDTFSDAGRPVRRRWRPARVLQFAYDRATGTVLLASHLRSRERIGRLLAVFGQAVLGRPVLLDEAAFDLDALKGPFRPLPDAPDMLSVRVKALHLRSASRVGRRLLKLETSAGDSPAAVEEMLRVHAPARALAGLRVWYAEVEVRLQVEGGVKSYAIRLWPHRSNLGRTLLHDRFRACLARWGLCHHAS